MSSPKRNSLFLGIAASLAVISPFIFFSTKPHLREDTSLPIRLVQELIYPLEALWRSSSDWLAETAHRYVFLSHAARENESLKEELQLAKAKNIQFDELVRETNRLRSLLGLLEKKEPKVVAAEVLGTPSRLPFESVRIARGTNDGIKVGYPVVTPEGLVGRIVRVGKNFADAQLLVDSDFHVDVLLQRTRVRGILRGNRDGTNILQLHRRAEVLIGDNVITSGIVGSFPKGLPVGRVTRISYEADNVTQTITIEPWVDYRRLDEVVVYFNESPEIQRIADAAGEEWLPQSVGGGGSGGG